MLWFLGSVVNLKFGCQRPTIQRFLAGRPFVAGRFLAEVRTLVEALVGRRFGAEG